MQVPKPTHEKKLSNNKKPVGHHGSIILVSYGIDSVYFRDTNIWEKLT